MAADARREKPWLGPQGAYDKIRARTSRNWEGKRIRRQQKSSSYRGQKDRELLRAAWLMTTQHRDRQDWGFKGEGWADGNALWPLWTCPPLPPPPPS